MSLDRYIVVIERNHADDMGVLDAQVGTDIPENPTMLRSLLIRQLRRELQEGWDAAAIAGHFRIVDCQLGTD